MDSGSALSRTAAAVLAGAIVAAPFLALLIRAELGLIVMAVGLGATSILLREALEATPVRTRTWPRVVIAINGLLAVGCVAVAVWLLADG